MNKIQSKVCKLGDGSFYFSPPIDHLVRLILPFLLGGLYVFFLYLIFDYQRFLQFGGLLFLYIVPPAGKESIIPAAIGLGFSWEIICTSIFVVDFLCSVFLLWNFDIVLKIPILGTWILNMMKKSQNFLTHHSWLKGLELIGLILFVFFPLQGTGTMSGSVIGRIMGFPTHITLGAVSIGSFLSSFMIGLSVVALNTYFNVNIWHILAIIIVIVALMSIGSYFRILMIKHRKERLRD